jgi:3-methyl-2-oxobutanoate hydroxymethyltransferase
MSTEKRSSRQDKVTTQTVVKMKQEQEKISMLTAYDYTMAGIVDAAGIDVILVGDSASNVMAGFDTTVPMTLDHMIYHTSCVVRGVDRALVIADLPFMSYQVTAKEALISAGRMMKEAGAHAVKLEGGKVITKTVKKIVDAGIPVMGHLGLTPQSIYKFGSYKVRAKEEEEADQLLEDAKKLEKAGVFSIVLEKF